MQSMKGFFLCAILFSGGRCLAQVPVPPDQCLGGTLVGVQADSVTLKFNDKINTYRLLPGAEIWTRGADVASPMKLAIGDDVYLKCTRTEAGGPILATGLAAVEKFDGIEFVPQHIRVISACVGKLVTRTSDTLSLGNDKGGCVIHTTARTTYWRGETSTDPGVLKVGDEVSARVIVSYPGRVLTAEGEVEANVAKAEVLLEWGSRRTTATLCNPPPLCGSQAKSRLTPPQECLCPARGQLPNRCETTSAPKDNDENPSKESAPSDMEAGECRPPLPQARIIVLTTTPNKVFSSRKFTSMSQRCTYLRTAFRIASGGSRRLGQIASDCGGIVRGLASNNPVYNYLRVSHGKTRCNLGGDMTSMVYTSRPERHCVLNEPLKNEWTNRFFEPFVPQCPNLRRQFALNHRNL